MELYTFHLFAGGGGGILADLLLGHIPVGAVEIEEYPRRVLLCRQATGALPAFPIWDDVRTFRSDNPDTRDFIGYLRAIRGNLCISGGFPCQDISAAGKGAGISGAKSGLWKEFARIINEIRPRYAFVENSPLLVRRGLDVVLQDITEMGYDSAWGIVSAGNAGAPHKRERFWLLAHDDMLGRDQAKPAQVAECKVQQSTIASCERTNVSNADHVRELQPEGSFENVREWTCDGSENLSNADGFCCDRDGQTQCLLLQRKSKIDIGSTANSNGTRFKEQRVSKSAIPEHKGTKRNCWEVSQSRMGRMADGMADWMDGSFEGDWFEPGEHGIERTCDQLENRAKRLKALGNGQVPQCAALAFEILMQRLMKTEDENGLI